MTDCILQTLQLADVGGRREHGSTGQQELRPAEEKATKAQNGYPNHPADARRHTCVHTGKTTTVKFPFQVKKNTGFVKFYISTIKNLIPWGVMVGRAVLFSYSTVNLLGTHGVTVRQRHC